MTAIADIDSFAITLPDVWAMLPLGRPAFDQRMADLVAQWRATPGWTRTTERRAELIIDRARRELRRAGCSFVAAFCDVGLRGDAAPGDVVPEPIMAVCTYGVYDRADLGVDVRLTLPILWAAFTQRHQTSGPARIIDLEPPTSIELRPGKALHLRRLYEPTRIRRDMPDKVYADVFVFSVGDDGEAAGLLQFATPNIELAADFSQLFVGIARTFTTLTPEQDTVQATAGGHRG
jgi:hypothetical protein